MMLSMYARDACIVLVTIFVIILLSRSTATPSSTFVCKESHIKELIASIELENRSAYTTTNRFDALVNVVNARCTLSVVTKLFNTTLLDNLTSTSVQTLQNEVDTHYRQVMDEVVSMQLLPLPHV